MVVRIILPVLGFLFLVRPLSAQSTPVQDAEFFRLINEDILRLPSFLQLVFHDCLGGCDGCVDTSRNDNVGLVNTIVLAKDFCRDFMPGSSQADCNVFLGTRALQELVRRGDQEIDIPLTEGRVDCDESQGFPFRNFYEGDNPNSLGFLADAFGTNDEEGVALLGCHSAGQAFPFNSGFDGIWDRDPDKIDNGFFRNLLSSGWQTERVQNVKVNSTQFRRGVFMMLIADMSLIKELDIIPGDEFRTPSCNVQQCDDATTASIVRDYAFIPQLFIEHLRSAFIKMVTTTPEPTITTTTEPTIPTTTEPATPTTTEPTIPTTTEPTIPTTTEPTILTTTEPTIPTTPEQTIPTTPESTIPTTTESTIPTTTEPAIPTTTEPIIPTTTEPTIPTTTEPTIPTTTEPTIPTTTEPAIPTTTEPAIPTTTEPTIPTTTEPTVTAATVPTAMTPTIDPATTPTTEATATTTAAPAPTKGPAIRATKKPYNPYQYYNYYY